jgi:small subunit ribosomal protein S6
MPQYELMYLLGSHVADTDVPAITEQIQKFVADFGGTDIKETQLGKKKLAYPIKKTRNGHYIVVNFTMDGRKVNELDAKIRTQDSTIIRYILVNLEEHMERMSKDTVAQSKLIRRPQPETGEEGAMAAAPAPKKEVKREAPVLNEINQEELDKKIEEALTEDLTK